MTSVDDLFKKPGYNVNGKRKLEHIHDPSAYYKSAKTSTNGDAKGKTHATVEDEVEDDVEAGPALPPDDEDDYGPDDEEGRFFEGGIDSSVAAALDYVDQREKADDFVEETYDVKWVRSLGVKFEKTINRNQELRSKFENDPQKFMASEADLDAQIKDLSVLSEHPELYPDFAEQGCVGSLVSLLSHDNTDIAIDAIETLSQLIDEDVQASDTQWSALVNAALEADLLNLLSSNFSRLDEQQEADRDGIQNALSILESLASSSTTSSSVCKEPEIVAWLLNRIKRIEDSISSNKLYAAEVISISAQSSQANRAVWSKADAVNILLELLAPYRLQDPSNDAEEEEYAENLFDTLTSLTDSPEGKSAFVVAEGVELMLIMLREGKMSKPRALRVLDHAVGSMTGSAVCQKIVQKQGLKTLFGMFMKKQDASSTEHLLGIFASMLRSLPADSAERIRLLAKFVEKDYEKIQHLMVLRRQYASKLTSVDSEINIERRATNQDELEKAEAVWLSRRLDAGLFPLQMLDIILAWLVAEDSGAKRKVVELLSERDETLDSLRKSLQEQLDGADDETEDSRGHTEMIATLIDHLI